MILSQEEAWKVMERGSHILITRDGKITTAFQYHPELFDHIVKHASEKNEPHIGFAPAISFGFKSDDEKVVGVLVKLDGSNTNKLFQIPSDPLYKLAAGARVLCQTSEGRKEGVVSSSPVTIEKSMFPVITALTGAKFPLRPIVAVVQTIYFDPYHE